MALSKERFKAYVFHQFGDDPEEINFDTDGNGAWIENPDNGRSFHIENKPTGFEVEGYAEQGHADRQLSPTEIQEIANEVGKVYNLEQSHFEPHVHGVRLYLHTKETVSPAKLFDTLEKIETANSAVAEALTAARFKRGLSKKEFAAEVEDY